LVGLEIRAIDLFCAPFFLKFILSFAAPLLLQICHTMCVLL
jgi:hypothetical protein